MNTNHRPFSLRTLLVGGALLAFSGGIAQAQDAAPQTPALAPIVAPETQVFRYQVRNLPSPLLAYWIDPARQPMPPQLQSSLRNSSGLNRVQINHATAPFADSKNFPANPYLKNEGGETSEREVGLNGADQLPRRPLESALELRPGNGNGPLNFKLPDGIVSIESLDTRNILEIKGTPEASGALQKLLVKLDVPLQQTELNAVIAEFAPAELKTLGLKFSTGTRPPNDKFPITAVALAPDFPRDFAALVADSRARVINAPRLILVSGLSGSLTSSESRGVVVEERRAEAQTKSRELLFFISSDSGITVNAVIRGELISMSAEISWGGTVAQMQVDSLRDGQTCAVRLPVIDANPDLVRVIFITPRIIRRTVE